MVRKTVPAGLFKQGCLALLDEVSEGGVELVVTKRGRPVARVVPIAGRAERDAAVLTELRKGTRTLAAEATLLRPSSERSPWEALGRAPGKGRAPAGRRR